MVQTIAESAGMARRKIVVAGEMLELGADAARMHRNVGRDIGRSGIDVLWGVRDLGADLIEGARDAGMSIESTRFFPDSVSAAEALSEEVKEGDLILVKGSRGVRTDKIVSLLKDRFPELGEDER
jgi:UDP-N-acetylmuramoyl-tripeptide--D-alanyl-D-alanine ligase